MTALAAHGRDLYVAGSFVEAGGVAAYRVAKWNGQFWAPLGFGAQNGINGSVFSLGVDDSGVYVGGQFTTAGGAAANNIAQWEFATPPPRVAQLAGRVTDDGLPAGAALQATWTKTSGPASDTIVSPGSYTTNIRGLMVGTYIYHLTATDNSGGVGFADVTIIVQPAKVTTTIEIHIRKGTNVLIITDN